MKNRTEQCIMLETRMKEQEAERQKWEKDKKKLLLEHHTKIKKEEKRNKTVQEQLVHSKPIIRDRKKILANHNAKIKNIPNFETVIQNKRYTLEVLKNCLKAGPKGSVLIFKKCYIDKIPEKERCIRPRDIARDKYQYFDGKEWLTVKLDMIVEVVCDQLHQLYKPVLKEKWEKLEEIDKKYPPWIDSEKNMKYYDSITDQYADETTYWSELTQDLLKVKSKQDIKFGIRELMVTINDKQESV